MAFFSCELHQLFVPGGEDPPIVGQLGLGRLRAVQPIDSDKAAAQSVARSKVVRGIARIQGRQASARATKARSKAGNSPRTVRRGERCGQGQVETRPAVLWLIAADRPLTAYALSR